MDHYASYGLQRDEPLQRAFVREILADNGATSASVQQISL